MKLQLIIIMCLMICLSSCSRKVNYSTRLAQKTLNKTGSTKKGKTLYKWYFSDISRDLILKLFEPDTSSADILRRGIIKETIVSSGDEFIVPRNTVGGALGSETLNEINIKFDKETDRTIPFEPMSDGNYYLKTIDVVQQVNVFIPAGYYQQWNPYFGCYQTMWVQAQWETQTVTRYFVKIKSPNGQEKIYEANYKIMLYIRHKIARKIDRTSKTASGYKPN